MMDPQLGDIDAHLPTVCFADRTFALPPFRIDKRLNPALHRFVHAAMIRLRASCSSTDPLT
jgi:hypothetical protein